jgi:hypothetical protein
MAHAPQPSGSTLCVIINQPMVKVDVHFDNIKNENLALLENAESQFKFVWLG